MFEGADDGHGDETDEEEDDDDDEVEDGDGADGGIGSDMEEGSNDGTDDRIDGEGDEDLPDDQLDDEELEERQIRRAAEIEADEAAAEEAYSTVERESLAEALEQLKRRKEADRVGRSVYEDALLLTTTNPWSKSSKSLSTLSVPPRSSKRQAGMTKRSKALSKQYYPTANMLSPDAARRVIATAADYSPVWDDKCKKGDFLFYIPREEQMACLLCGTGRLTPRRKRWSQVPYFPITPRLAALMSNSKWYEILLIGLPFSARPTCTAIPSLVQGIWI